MSYSLDPNTAVELDARDALASYRQRFHIPKTQDGQECIYFCGNSLGLQPRSVEAAVQQELNDWKVLGVEGHLHAKNPWYSYHELLTKQSAALVGAKPFEVVVMNSLTVNLHIMMTSFYRPNKSRYKILIEAGAFPSDRYAVESQIRLHGFDPKTALIEWQPRKDEKTLQIEDLEKIVMREGDRIALILIGGVNYYTGQFFDLQKITALGHKKNCMVGFDLAHAVGNVVLNLHEWNVDFACWCSYKYLNSGPGGVGGCFIHEKHCQDKDIPRFWGWWGHDKKERFKMEPEFKVMSGAEGWQLSNPPILSLAAVKASLDIFHEIGIDKLRVKSMQLTGYLSFLLGSLKSDKFFIMTPSVPGQRGCQLSIVVKKDGKKVFQELAKQGIICDWREPDCMRVAPVPLYNSYSDVYKFFEVFKKAIA